MTAISEAMVAAYFQRPPDSDWLELDNDFVLACPVPPRLTSGTVKADVLVASQQTFPVDGVAQRLRGDRDKWRLKREADKRYEDRLTRAKRFHPRQVDGNPAEYISLKDREIMIELARNIMAEMCHLTTYLPRCQILAPKWATRLCEMIEREMWSLEQWGKKLTEQIAAETRSLGGTRVDEITNATIERLEQQRMGARLQYHHCQIVLHAFKLQYDEVGLEYDHLKAILPGMEGAGKKFRDYTPLRDRVERRQKLAKEGDRALQAQLAMLHQKSEQDYRKWVVARTRYEPRHGQPEIAEGISEQELWSEE